MQNLSLRNFRIILFLICFVNLVLLAGEMFFIVTNSNRSDFFEEGEPQNMSSGLYSAYIHQQNSDYNKIRAKCALLVDFDLDKDLDLYYGYNDATYFVNDNGYFTTLTTDNQISDIGARGMVAGDLDNNGYPDILKWRYDNDDPHEILLNFGSHQFESIEYLENDEHPRMHSEGILDYDLDGDLDFISISDTGDVQFFLYENIGLDNFWNPQFEMVYSFGEFDNSSSRTLAISDFDNDGDQDIFVVRKYSKNWLMRNETIVQTSEGVIYNDNQNNHFIEVSSSIGLTDTDVSVYGSMGYGAAWGDYDNDEDFDLYLVNWEVNRLFINEDGEFINIADNTALESDSLGNGISFGDFDNDGQNEVWAGTMRGHDDLYTLIDDQWSEEQSPVFLSSSQDIVAGDINNDGWLDIFAPGLNMGNNGTPAGPKFTSLLYENITDQETSTNNHWIIIYLEGSMISSGDGFYSTKSNKSAIGARVTVNAGGTKFIREMIAGKGHGSMDALQLHFGVGTASIIEQIEVRWPSLNEFGTSLKTELWENIPVDTILTIVEDIGFVGYKGDFNMDQSVNVIDVVNLVHTVLLEIEVTDFQLWHADMDYSLNLDIIDIVRLVQFIVIH